jgi:hypothetical protein
VPLTVSLMLVVAELKTTRPIAVLLTVNGKLRCGVPWRRVAGLFGFRATCLLLKVVGNARGIQQPHLS